MVMKIGVAAALFFGMAFAGEGLHLTNCQSSDSDDSWMFYYSNDASAQNPNNSPTDKTIIQSFGYYQWEGKTTTGTFSDTGVKFTATINANAASQPVGTQVGTGYNGSNWKCYKDNGRTLWAPSGQKFTCSSIYYCLK